MHRTFQSARIRLIHVICGVRGEDGDITFAEPWEACGVGPSLLSGVGAPTQLALPPWVSGAETEDVARSDPDPLCRLGLLEILGQDLGPWFEPVQAAKRRDG